MDQDNGGQENSNWGIPGPGLIDQDDSDRKTNKLGNFCLWYGLVRKTVTTIFKFHWSWAVLEGEGSELFGKYSLVKYLPLAGLLWKLNEA